MASRVADTRSDDYADDHRALRSVLARMPRFDGDTARITPLPGGLTNRIYKISPRAGAPLVGRVSFGQSSLLAIDRLAECHNSDAAARAGVAPAVVACEPAEGVSVIEWIDGRTFGPADIDDSAQLIRIAALCRNLHRGPRFVNDFDMFAVQQGYLGIVQDRGFRLPAGYLDHASRVERIRTALAARPEPTVPCHNDLLAANMMDDGARLWFIDFEYAGNNDPCFELGNIWSEAELGLDRLEELVTAYYGEPSPARTARARLYALMARYGWTLWASIQAAVSDVDFDFWSWGQEKYARAVEEFTGPQLDRLIDDVQQTDTTAREQSQWRS
ncbi:MAG TPA: choline kinase family protein [Jatrophihabitans sp.]|uniref:choline kinase family protein n=1 Tax=Jatrophihabitans sp. TaxID=1932789 RepID=UPI002DFA27E0|nr:choline kinase family protein [Jatrophihabitans sp.]